MKEIMEVPQNILKLLNEKYILLNLGQLIKEITD
jgi:hypothetical protein